MTKTEPTKGTLKDTEYHPMADVAMAWLRAIPYEQLLIAREALASTAISGNRTAEVCYETLERLMRGEKVSDRYLLGLCWLLRDMQDNKQLQP